MMKHNLKELDQFFDAARNEPPLMSDDAFASIVDKADATVQTEVMRNSPTSRIISAIRQQQGGMIMTGLGLTALTGLLVTGYYLSPADSQQPTKLAAINTPAAIAIQATTANAVQDPASQVIHQVKQHSASSSNELAVTTDPKPTSFRHPISFDSVWSRVKVESLKPIEITAKEIDELGVNDAGDGKVFLVHELNNGGVRMKMAFPPTGMDAAYDFKVGGADQKDDAKVTPIMPTMVTDAMGKKLAFFFKSQVNDNSINIESASMSQRDGFFGDEPGSNGPQVQMNINIVETNDEDIDVADEDDDGVNDLEEAFTTFPDIPAGSMNFKIDGPKFNVDSMMKLHGGMGAKFMVLDGMDSAFNGKFNFDFKFDSDSLVLNALAMAERMQGMEQHGIQLRMNVDSLKTHVMKHMKVMNIDSLHKNMKILRKQMKNIRIDSIRGLPELQKLEDLRDLPQFHIENLPRMKNFDLPIIQVDIEKIENLVPVKIKDIDPSVKHNQNGLIFWYARDKKFMDKAPVTLVEKVDEFDPLVNEHAQKSVSKASVINEPMVYPNPTPGRAIFKYSLGEPRAVSIAVHDLLGKQVMKVTDLETKSAGTFEKEIDLSTLEAGVYLLIMVTDAGEQITQRVVIER
jgi:hypothetical protein